MEGKRRYSGMRPWLIAAVLSCAPLAAGPAGGGLSAQEMPAGVASELVDQALAQDLAGPEVRQADGTRLRPDEIFAWFTIALASSILFLGWMDKRRDRRRKATTPAAEGHADAGGTVDGEATPGDDRAQRPERPGPRPATTSPAGAPTAALALPPHVLEILERAAARRAAEAAAGGQPAPEPSRNGEPIDPDSPEVDYVVPGYDPWNGR